MACSVHCGDMANMVGSIALSPKRIWTARIELEDQALAGAASVLLPGTSLGKAGILAAASAPDLGANLAGKCRLLFAAACLAPGESGGLPSLTNSCIETHVWLEDCARPMLMAPVGLPLPQAR